MGDEEVTIEGQTFEDLDLVQYDLLPQEVQDAFKENCQGGKGLLEELKKNRKSHAPEKPKPESKPPQPLDEAAAPHPPATSRPRPSMPKADEFKAQVKKLKKTKKPEENVELPNIAAKFEILDEKTLLKLAMEKNPEKNQIYQALDGNNVIVEGKTFGDLNLTQYNLLPQKVQDAFKENCQGGKGFLEELDEWEE